VMPFPRVDDLLGEPKTARTESLITAAASRRCQPTAGVYTAGSPPKRTGQPRFCSGSRNKNSLNGALAQGTGL
jgi:hypothetical protein